MNMKSISSFSQDELKDMDVDVCIIASGYESRARTLAQDLAKHKVNIANKYAWGFKEYSQEKIRLKNDLAVKELGYKQEIFPGNNSLLPNIRIKELLMDGNRKKQLIYIVDVSSMSRTWYGAIIQALSQLSYDGPIRTIFAYTPAVCRGEVSPFPPNEVLAPLPGYSSHALPNKPTALIIGLGQESGRALGLKEHLDPEAVLCFYTDPSTDCNYINKVLDANQDLLERLDQNYIYKYNVMDTFGTYKTLESICNGLMRDFRVVMASLGPKIFGIYCLLLATQKQNLSVWRVSPASSQKPVDQKPSQDRIYFAVDWQ
jgi:hypothetical protein